MIVNLTGGPLDGQTKNVKQPTDNSLISKPLPMPVTLTWPTENHKGARYIKQTEGSRHTASEYKYEE